MTITPKNLEEIAAWVKETFVNDTFLIKDDGREYVALSPNGLENLAIKAAKSYLAWAIEEGEPKHGLIEIENKYDLSSFAAGYSEALKNHNKNLLNLLEE
jgi:hypothetical protein